MYKGIDISHYAGEVDFSKLNVEFIIIKIGNTGDTSFKFKKDFNFEYYYNEAKKNNIKVGGYVYTYTNYIQNMKEATDEFIDYIKDFTFDLPIYLDVEAEELKTETKENLNSLIDIFNKQVEKSGNWAGIYANLDWFKNYLDEEYLINRYTSWIAHYYKNPKNLEKYNGKYDMWQYSENVKLEGIEGTCDLNIMYRDLFTEMNPVENELTNIIRCSKNQTSLVDGLKELGVDSSFVNRTLIANKNGLTNYIGSYSQNIYLLEMLKEGKLEI